MSRAVKLVDRKYGNWILAGYLRIYSKSYNMPRLGLETVLRNYSNALIEGGRVLDRRVVRLGVSLPRQFADPQQRTPTTVMRALSLACREHQGMGRYRGGKFARVLRMHALARVQAVDEVILEYVDDVLQIVAAAQDIPMSVWIAGASGGEVAP